MMNYQKIKNKLQYYYTETNAIYIPLRIVLVLIIGVNGMAVMFGILGFKWGWDHPGSIALKPLALLTGISWLMMIFATKLWKFKKWAFWGLCFCSLAHLIFIIADKGNYRTAISVLLVPVVVFLCLQIGDKRKGWLRM